MNADEATPRLEPCPFCGATPKPDGDWAYMQHQTGCGFGVILHGGSHRIWPDQAEAWNTRAHDALVAERAALRKAIEPFAKLAMEPRPIGEIQDYVTCSIRVDDLLAAHKAFTKGE